MKKASEGDIVRIKASEGGKRYDYNIDGGFEE